jgi:hypothetical protein
MAWFAIGLIVPMLAAYVWIARCDREAPSGIATFFLRTCLAIGIGVGISSCACFLWLFFLGTPGTKFYVCELGFFTIAGLIGWMWNRRANGSPNVPWKESCSGDAALFGNGPISRLLVFAFLASLVLALSGAIATFEKMPIGDWDAWAIWNLRARTLFRAGDAWRVAFSPEYVHSDYPLLVPLGNMRGWSYLGGEASWTPWFFGCLLTFASVGVLTAGVCRLRSRCLGLLAGIALLGTIPFIQCGATQYADVPLAFFMLAAVLLLVLYDASTRRCRGLLVLSGLAAGLAAWTKNEGLLFLVVLPVVRAAVVCRRNGMKQALIELAYWIAGACPAIAVIALQKIDLVGENDLVGHVERGVTLARLCDPSRYWLVAQSLVLSVLRTARPLVVIVPVCYFLLGTAKQGDRNLSGWSTALLAILGMFVGYFCVYVAMSGELQWHLQTSVGRLILHVCPLGMLVVFLKLATPEEAMETTVKSSVF